MKQIGVGQLLVAHSEQPNEVCLTLYIEEAGYNLIDKVKELTEPEIGIWKHNPYYQLPPGSNYTQYQQEAYKATEPHECFQSIYLFFIRPDVTTKTQAVQLLISSVGEPEKSWAQASDWLHHAWLRLTNTLKKEYLGYSITYQASIHHVNNEVPVIKPDLLNTLWWIHEHRKSPARKTITAQCIKEAGWLWTVSYPETLKGGIVYLALGWNGKCTYLSSEAFATRDSVLCSIDAFTHKGLRQGLELMKEYNTYELNVVKPLQAAISQLLQKESEAAKLDQMARSIKPYANFCWDAARLAHSIRQQISGINRLYLGVTMPPVASYHQFLLKAYEEEAQAIAIKNKDTLNIARTALSMAEATESKRSNSNQERFNTLIALVGIFLAADQILDTDFAKELLAFIDFKMTVTNISKPTFTTEKTTVVPYWAIFTSRILSSLSLTGIIFSVGWIIRRRNKWI